MSNPLDRWFLVCAALAALVATPVSRADWATIELDSVATEVLGTPVAIHRMYARPALASHRINGVQKFQVIAGSALFHHRDFETEGVLSTTLGTWNPYLVGALASAGDTYLIIGGNTGPAAAGTISFDNWSNDEFARAQTAFHGLLYPGVAWQSLVPSQGSVDANGRVVLAQFVTRLEDAFTVRFDLFGASCDLCPAWEEFHTATISLDGSADYCPDDPEHEFPGQCGCGSPDTDSDGDGAADCLDRALALVQQLDLTDSKSAVPYGMGETVRADGDLALVTTGTTGSNLTATTVLRRQSGGGNSTTWVPEFSLLEASTDSDDHFVEAALSGNRMALRVNLVDLPPTVRVFERTAKGSWQLDETFEPDPLSPLPAIGFGSGLALHGDWLAIGNTNPWTPMGKSGRVELRHRDASGWSVAATLEEPVKQQVRFGRELALGDGVLVVSDHRILAVYAPNKAGAWELTQLLSPPNGYEYEGFGEVLAIDGDVLVAGCSDYHAGTAHYVGGAIVYRRGVDGLFSVEAVLRPEERVLPFVWRIAQNLFGDAVSVRGDVIAVGGKYTDRAYVYRRGSSGAWRCEHVIARDLADSHDFGRALALTDHELLVCAPDIGVGPWQPRVDIFDLDPSRLGDIDGDGLIGAADVAALLSAWGTANSQADLDGDGIVGAPDLTMLLANWTMV